MVTCMVIALLAAPASASAPADDAAITFRRALFDFSQGEYRSVTEKLTPLVDAGRISSEDDLAEARKVLGTVFYLLGDKQKARAHFELLVLLRPQTELDPYSTAPPVLRFYAEVKAEALSKAEEMQRVFNTRREQFEAPRYIERKAVKHSELLAFLPFGIGQFQNGDVGLGVMFLAFDVVALAANIFGYITLQLEATPQGVLRVEGQRIRTTWLSVQYAGLGAFALGWIAGAIHARLFFQPVVNVERELMPSGSKSSTTLGLQVGIGF